MSKQSTDILVTGGAGYIGSHMVLQLLESDESYNIIVLDDLSNGARENLDFALDNNKYNNRCKFIKGDFGDTKLLNQLFAKYDFLAVMHFAAFIKVGESVQNPQKYYKNNFDNTKNLCEQMGLAGIKHFVFSSTAAIFGNPDIKNIPLKADAPQAPINPYGDSKLKVEQVLPEFEKKYGLKSVCLRYFNVAGVDPSYKIIPKEKDTPTHLIPLVLQAASGRREDIKIFGDDYPTIDGTCVRDYIHVVDLCAAHLLALKKLQKTNKSFVMNLGYGNGFSVKQVIEVARLVTKINIKAIVSPRRDGDPAELIASSEQVKALGWQPKYANLADIIEHAWAAEKRKKLNNNGNN